MPAVCFNHIYPLEQRMQHDAVKIFHEQQVAARTENQAANPIACMPTEKFNDVVLRIEPNIASGGRLDVEGIQGFQ